MLSTVRQFTGQLLGIFVCLRRGLKKAANNALCMHLCSKTRGRVPGLTQTRKARPLDIIHIITNT